MTDMENALARLDHKWALRRGEETGGVEFTGRDEIADAGRLDFSRFLRNRHSVRQYAPDHVDPGIIREAVAECANGAIGLQPSGKPHLCVHQPRGYRATARAPIRKHGLCR